MNGYIKSLKQQKDLYEQARFEVAKLAYKEISEVIDKWQQQNDAVIEVFWDGVIEVDGEQFQAEDFEDRHLDV